MKMKCGMKERKQIESRIINENNGHGNDNTTKYPVGATIVYFFIPHYYYFFLSESSLYSA